MQNEYLRALCGFHGKKVQLFLKEYLVLLLVFLEIQISNY